MQWSTTSKQEGNPNSFKVSMTKSQFNLSCAFSKSILMAIQPFFPFPLLHGMDDLLSYDNVILRLFVRDKTTLTRTNNFIHDHP